MTKTLKITFALKNTYRVNSILYALKQIPIVGKIFPEYLYQVEALKILANMISVIWEVISAFLGKGIYMGLMVFMAANMYEMVSTPELFMHILVFLTVIGAFVNTYMFNPSRDKYYALILLRMDAKAYTLINYGYAILKVIAGFLIFALIFGLLAEVPLWLCILLPFFVAGLKLSVAAYALWDYERTGNANNENKLGKLGWLAVFVLLAAAYGLPLTGFVLPQTVVMIVMVISVAAGALSVKKIISFKEYYEVYRQILTESMVQMDTASKAVRDQSRKMISVDTGISSKKKGFEFLNELFIKRHQKILWKSSKRIAFVCLCLTGAGLLIFYLVPETKIKINGMLLTYLPYFVFIMYAINRGTGFTRALFMNCDHSLLTYSFYKQPDFILKLFKIRLKEIVKVNLLPALVIGAGLAVLMYASGGTENPLNYAVLIVSILSMSVFFSVHYLTIYYLLQPYNAGTEMKNPTYQIVMSVTYFICFFMMKIKMPTLIFGIAAIIFCVLYSVIACILIYKMAPGTFKLRG